MTRQLIRRSQNFQIMQTDVLVMQKFSNYANRCPDMHSIINFSSRASISGCQHQLFIKLTHQYWKWCHCVTSFPNMSSAEIRIPTYSKKESKPFGILQRIKQNKPHLYARKLNPKTKELMVFQLK